MNFGQALEALNEGKKIKVPEWGGYWFKQSGMIKVMTAEGVILETPHFQQYIFREDWEIAEKDNKKEYNEPYNSFDNPSHGFKKAMELGTNQMTLEQLTNFIKRTIKNYLELPIEDANQHSFKVLQESSNENRTWEFTITVEENSSEKDAPISKIDKNETPTSKGYDDKFYIFEGEKIIYESSEGFSIIKEDRHVVKALKKFREQNPQWQDTSFITIKEKVNKTGVAPTVMFTIQSDPISEVGVNGVQALDMLAYTKCLFESLNEAFPCRENALTITKIEEAIHWQEARTRDRMRRKVEGKNKA
jgi:hypothetical protein